MNVAFLEVLSAIAVLGWVCLLWVFWGRAARAAGLTRLTLFGSIALLGWLLG